MEFTKFTQPNGVAVTEDQAKLIAQAHNAQGLTDDGTSPIAKPMASPIEYFDPGLPLDHGPALIAKNTLQQAYAEKHGFLADRAKVKEIRAQAQAAKDAARGD